ncbi:MAG TPA: SAM-dependent methyltransferase [Gemmatimonadaceae bacterium]|nr:SAM-dependent methyltransferase [Gemmatimonadaceae bacterium]
MPGDRDDPLNEPITFRPIGHVRGGPREVVDDYWGDVESAIELVPGLPAACLDGIDAFSHAEILFFFDRPDPVPATFTRHPRNNPAWPRVGIFAERSKRRPNRIGLTIVRIARREGNMLHVIGLDAVDGTPVLDIKPVMEEFLTRGEVRQPAWAREMMRDYWRPARERPPGKA